MWNFVSGSLAKSYWLQSIATIPTGRTAGLNISLEVVSEVRTNSAYDRVFATTFLA